MPLTYTQITETFTDGTGQPMSNINVSFAPSETVYAAGIPVVTPGTPIAAKVVGGALEAASGGTLQLLDTSNTGLTIEGRTGFWFWTVTITGQLTDSFSFFLPHSATPVDLYSLANTAAGGGGSAVTSVFGRSGAVVAQSGDYSAAQVGALPLAGGTLTGWLAPAVVALTDAATIAVDADDGNDFRVTLGGSRTMGAPSNPTDGQDITFLITQPASGGPYTPTFASGSGGYSFGGGSAPTWSTAANATDMVAFKYRAAASKWLCMGSALGF